MRVVVTGGCGFIGSHLVEALVERGSRVRVFDRWLSEEIGNLAARGAVGCLQGDVRDSRQLHDAFRGAQMVYHLGSILGTSESIERYDPVEVAETNVLGTCRVLAAARELGVGRVVYPSTPDVPWLNPYKITKHAAEKFCLLYCREFGLETVVLRLANVYGPRERWLQAPSDAPFNYQKVIPTFVVHALTGKPLPIFGDGEQSSEYVYVGDVVQALLLAGAAPAAGEVVPIGTGRPVRVRDLAEAVLALTGSRSPVEFLPMRRGEVPVRITVDPDIARKKLGFSAGVGLDEGLSRTVPYYRRVLGL